MKASFWPSIYQSFSLTFVFWDSFWNAGIHEARAVVWCSIQPPVHALRVAHRSWMRRSYHPFRTNCCVFVEPESTFMHIGGNDESFQPTGPIWSESFSPLAQHLATTHLSEPVSTCDPTLKPGFTVLDRQYTRALEGQLQGEVDVAFWKATAVSGVQGLPTDATEWSLATLPCGFDSTYAILMF